MCRKLLFLATLLFPLLSMAQSTCDDGRYDNLSYFDTIVATRDIVYGQNQATGGGNQILELDFFDSPSDKLAKRPLIIWAFGGSFIGGQREDVEGLAVDFASMGYATATIDYRVGFFIPNQVNTTLAVLRAMHDMKASIRFFYKDAQTDNLYRIDTNRIIVAGVSAGAITAIHEAYLNDTSEIPPYLSPSIIASVGGIEGNSGNPGYSSNVAAVVNYSGAIGDTSWINPGDAVMVSVHDSLDSVVPYFTEEVNVSGIPTGLIASGSGDIHVRMQNIGVYDTLRTYPGNGHVSYLGSDYANTIELTKSVLLDKVACSSDTSTIDPDTSVGIASIEQSINMQFYPNPADGVLNIRVGEPGVYDLALMSTLGEIVATRRLNGAALQLDVSDVPAGMYLLQVASADNRTISHKVVVQ